MYWVPEYLGPGESRSYITNYGLGGITIVPGLLSLGITSPAEVLLDTPDRSIPVIAYVENTSEITAKMLESVLIYRIVSRQKKLSIISGTWNLVRLPRLSGMYTLPVIIFLPVLLIL